jgi:hypothetical protein
VAAWADYEDLVELIMCVAEFAAFSFTFESFARVRELLVTTFATTESQRVRRVALRAIGLFGSRSSAGVDWFGRLAPVHDLYAAPPSDDVAMLEEMLDVLGNGARNDQSFGICRSIGQLPPAEIEMYISFIERCVASEMPWLVQRALAAIADCLRASQRHVVDCWIARGILEQLLAHLSSDTEFRTKTQVMRVLCIFFVFLSGQTQIDFARAGFLDALFEWLEPMITKIGSELIDAVHRVFEMACENPELADWIELTAENEELLRVLDDFGECVPDPMSAEINAYSLKCELDEWRRNMER